MRLATFLAQPHPEAAVLHEHVLDLHGKRRADPRERIGHEGNQGAVAETGRRRRVDAVEELARLGRVQYRRFAGFYDVLRAAHGHGRVHRHDLADDQPIEQMADGGEMLFDGRRHTTRYRRAVPVNRCAKNGGNINYM
jgi:hypothetical protein